MALFDPGLDPLDPGLEPFLDAEGDLEPDLEPFLELGGVGLRLLVPFFEAGGEGERSFLLFLDFGEPCDTKEGKRWLENFLNNVPQLFTTNYDQRNNRAIVN